MLFSTVLMWLLIAAGFVIALPALWLLARALWPAMAAKNRAVAAKGLFKSFLVGLAPSVGGIALIVTIAKLPKMGVLALLIGGVFIAWGLLGAGGIASLIGERLWPDLGVAEPWRQTLRGGMVLICCTLLPVVGWFVLLPLLAIVGWGVNVRGWFADPKAAPLPAADAALAGTDSVPL